LTDFQKFLFGQTVSRMGTSFTSVITPLLVFRLTGSPVNLALSSAAFFLPYLFFGLLIGAWADRANRKRTMILAACGQALVVASVPGVAAAGHLTVWWIYAVTFTASTLSIFFSTSEFAAIPSLVPDKDALVRANATVQASYSAATIAGPLLAGTLSAFVGLPNLFLLDSGSFLVSAAMLCWVRTSFNRTAGRSRQGSLRTALGDGLRYVWSNPVLRALALVVGLVNFVSSTINAQLVLFAKQQLAATSFRIGILYAAGGAGVVLLSLSADPLRRHFTFSQVTIGALTLFGFGAIAVSLTREYWLGITLWAFMYGCTSLFNINVASLRQAITPNELLGRVVSIAQVMAWSAIPAGSLLGGLAIDRIGASAPVFRLIGVLIVAIAGASAFSPLGRVDTHRTAAPAPIPVAEFPDDDSG
jgi:predicted MFS family arabinose efflux permease